MITPTEERHLNIPLDPEISTKIANQDVRALMIAEESYGNSWKRRGGTDTFMMLARKFDRIENQCSKFGYNILEAIQCDDRPEGIIDDIRDLRRYLILVEQEMEQRNGAIAELPKSQDDCIPVGVEVAGEPASRGYVKQD